MSLSSMPTSSGPFRHAAAGGTIRPHSSSFTTSAWTISRFRYPGESVQKPIWFHLLDTHSRVMRDYFNRCPPILPWGINYTYSSPPLVSDTQGKLHRFHVACHEFYRLCSYFAKQSGLFWLLVIDFFCSRIFCSRIWTKIIQIEQIFRISTDTCFLKKKIW